MTYKLIECFSTANHKPVPEICTVLQYAEDYAKTHNYRVITIEHLILGHMIYIKNLIDSDTIEELESFLKRFPTIPLWYIPPDDYIKKSINLSNIKSVSSIKKVEVDIYLGYISDSYRCADMSTQRFNFEYFYMFLVKKATEFNLQSDYYIHFGTLKKYFNFNILDTRFYDNYRNYEYTAMDAQDFIRNLGTDTTINNLFSSPIELNYIKDLTHSAYNGELPDIIGRTQEIQRMLDILCKKNKNNPVLIGNPGVGKTALIYALANKIVANEISAKLHGHYILELDILGAISGARYRGDFEERIKKTLEKIISLVQHGNKIIVCIDEIHTIVGAGAAEGAIDSSSILKPFLMKSELKFIGTSTLKEYRTIEADKALERRFDTIILKEPSFEETIEILTGIKSSFENFHKVVIPNNTIETVISLSERYIPERFLPDKAIDLLDETCSIKTNLCQADQFHYPITISPDDVFVAVSQKKNIPIQKVHNSFDLMNLEDILSSKVIGQTHVFPKLAQAIRRTKAGLNDENRPLGSFLFAGPTGVGKTETAKALAELVFSGNIIRFDMSEYMEEHSVSKLIGSPPGYVGYNESGLLTEQVRRTPYCLILFDEIEKAHPKIYNLFLQILDEGCLTDSKGEHINFKNTIIIMTSNVGAKELSKNSLGFGEQSSGAKNVLSEVKNSFSPEFLNRLDDTIQFNSLSQEDILEITKLQISRLIKKLNSLNIKLDIADNVTSKIAQLGYSHEYGARELKRTIDRELKNPLSDFILQNDVTSISVDLIDNEIKISHTNKVLTPTV